MSTLKNDRNEAVKPPTASAAPASVGEQPLFKADTVLHSLRFGEYDTNAALGEFADNSVEAGARNIRFFVQSGAPASAVESSSRKKAKSASTEEVTEIALVDDGAGMDYDTLSKCLVLGESVRPLRPDGRKGIGRFGVGMTMGGISTAKRIEVYSRTSKTEKFKYVYLDLDLVSSEEQNSIKHPVEQEPPAEYVQYLQESTGTIVVLKKCDRLQAQPEEGKKGVSSASLVRDLKPYLGRTFRKFIHSGLNVYVNNDYVHLHDPLYLLGPTRFDQKGQTDLKAKQMGNTIKIPVDVPDKPGQKADVTVKLTLLPAEWRTHQGAGGSSFVKDRHIDDNEGVSVLRAEREVLYGHVPYIFGVKGEAASKEIDRWWGCEISFPPELDAYFQVRYIKRGAEPVTSLKDKIRIQIAESIKTFRRQIQSDWKTNEAVAATQNGVFHEAERAMANADTKLPRAPKNEEDETSPEREDETLSQLAEEVDTSGEDPQGAKTKEERKQELASKPYSIVPVKYPASFFYEPVFLPGKVIVKLNVNHPFYKQIFAPMCGNIDHLNDESDPMDGAGTPEQRLARKGFMLLLLSHAKAESFFIGANQDTLEHMRHQWGMTLASALTE